MLGINKLSGISHYTSNQYLLTTMIFHLVGKNRADDACENHTRPVSIPESELRLRWTDVANGDKTRDRVTTTDYMKIVSIHF